MVFPKEVLQQGANVVKGVMNAIEGMLGRSKFIAGDGVTLVCFHCDV